MNPELNPEEKRLSAIEGVLACLWVVILLVLAGLFGAGGCSAAPMPGMALPDHRPVYQPVVKETDLQRQNREIWERTVEETLGFTP